MLARFIRQLLFYLIHLIVNVLVAIQNVYQKISYKKSGLHKCEVTKSDIKEILEHMPKMSKRLKHIVVLADTDHHSMSDLARVVIWSLIAGIPYISFHDVTGQLKENEEKLFLEIERNKRGIPGCIKWINKPDLNGYTNGIQAHTIVVNVFTKSDGRPKIAECIQSIIQSKLYNKCNETLTVQEFGSALMSMYPSLPEPDLLLYTGPYLCTHGLLPWHIRLTEFIQLSLDHSVNIDKYIGALYKYHQCDQRFGK